MAEEKKFVPKYIRRLISADRIRLTFTKSGRTYGFTPEFVAEMQAKSLDAVAGAKRTEVAKAI